MREADVLWDELEKHFGPVRTKSERGRRNSAVGELRAAEVTPEEIEIVVDYCRRNFTHFSEGALCNWLSRALQENMERSNVRDLFQRMRETK